MKFFSIPSVLAAAAILSGCGTGMVSKIYEGEEKPDSEISSVFSGVTMHEGEQWAVVFLGVDQTLCPEDTLMSDNGPLPKNHCRTLLKLGPGDHQLRVVVQSINKVKFVGPIGTNSWKRTDSFLLPSMRFEAGTLYKVMPIRTESGWSAKIEASCKSENFQKSIFKMRPAANGGYECT